MHQMYNLIQQQIDFGRGQAANVLGQPGTIYRLNGSSSGDFIIPANIVFTEYPILRKVISKDPSLEGTAMMQTMIFNLIADLTPLVLGDVWIQTDPFYGVGATSVSYPTNEFNGICIASHGPIKKALGARLDRFANVFRPAIVPDANEYWNTSSLGAQPLQLTNGTWSLGAVGSTPSLIPVGLQVRSRMFGKPQFEPDIPGLTRYNEWYGYVPPLEGFAFRRGDRIITQNGNRFVVVNPWHQEAGFVGSQMALEYEIDRA